MGAKVFRFPRVVLVGRVGGLEGYLVSEGLMGVLGRSEGFWLVWVLPPAGAETEVMVVV